VVVALDDPGSLGYRVVADGGTGTDAGYVGTDFEPVLDGAVKRNIEQELGDWWLP
jgi:hypothetical protein